MQIRRFLGAASSSRRASSARRDTISSRLLPPEGGSYSVTGKSCILLSARRGGVLDSGPVAHFLCFRGQVTPKADDITRLRDAAERVAKGYGLEIFDVQLRREPIGMVLRVMIDRPDPGRVETIEESV